MKQTIDNLHIITLHAGYAEMDKDWNWKNVRSPFARLYYVTEGTAKVIIHAKDSQEDETITLRAGHLYFIPPFTLHSNVCEGVFKHYYIHVL
jgi:mannose-6-phosphate isomerase-like protein (cupin superfamily)